MNHLITKKLKQKLNLISLIITSFDVYRNVVAPVIVNAKQNIEFNNKFHEQHCVFLIIFLVFLFETMIQPSKKFRTATFPRLVHRIIERLFQKIKIWTCTSDRPISSYKRQICSANQAYKFNAVKFLS